MTLTRRGWITLLLIVILAAVVAVPAMALGVNGADILLLILVVAAVAIASTLGA